MPQLNSLTATYITKRTDKLEGAYLFACLIGGVDQQLSVRCSFYLPGCPGSWEQVLSLEGRAKGLPRPDQLLSCTQISLEECQHIFLCSLGTQNLVSLGFSHHMVTSIDQLRRCYIDLKYIEISHLKISDMIKLKLDHLKVFFFFVPRSSLGNLMFQG
jgi:hypothetical protein